MKVRLYLAHSSVLLLALSASSALADPSLTTLIAFNNTNGSNPVAGLLADSAGNLYGTTESGGANRDGTVFEIAVGNHILSTLTTFNGTNGASPQAGLIADAAGNLYGTTYQGGATSVGTVFEIAAGNHTLSTLATFNGTNGASPQAGLTGDAAGNLYGTTYQGGATSVGTVFEIAAGNHSLSTLTTFNQTNGAHPEAGLLADAAGNLYGTTFNYGPGGYGTVFEVAAGSHSLSTLTSFNYSNGAEPAAGLIADANGDLYGTTELGGTTGNGTVFEITAGSHSLSTLAMLTGNQYKAGPTAGLLADAAGNLYGTTNSGGANSCGTVFEIAAGTHILSALATFNSTNGAYPSGGLIADASGNLYGTTYGGGANGAGTVFELTNTGFVISVPEPGSLILIAISSVGLLARRRRVMVRHNYSVSHFGRKFCSEGVKRGRS